MNKKDEALERFNSGFNCSQAVFSVFSDELGISNESSLKIATGFGGGVGKGGICGAVSGGVMALGMKHGNSSAIDKESEGKTYKVTKELTDKFEQCHGSIICKQLLGYDVSKPEDFEILLKNGSFTEKCPKFIAEAVKIVEENL